jgi:hypothetical protein
MKSASGTWRLKLRRDPMLRREHEIGLTREICPFAEINHNLSVHISTTILNNKNDSFTVI